MRKIFQRAFAYQSSSRWLHEMELALLVSLFVILCRHSQQVFRLLGPEATWGGLTIGEIWYYGFDYLFVCGVLAVGAILLVAKADKRLVQDADEPMKELLRCVDAAVAGDLTVKPNTQLSGNLGRLGQGIERLVHVLSKSEDLVYHLSTLVENSSEAIISLTSDGTILSWNKGAQRMYGFSATEAKGKPISIVSPIDQGAEIKRHLEEIRKGERVQPFESLHEARNGRGVTSLVRLSAIFDSTRQVIGASFCAQELTPALKTNPSSQQNIPL